MFRFFASLLALLILSLPLRAAERCIGYAVDGAPASSAVFGVVGIADLNGDGVPDIAGFSSVLLGGTREVKLPGFFSYGAVAAVLRVTRSGQFGLLGHDETSLQSVLLSGDGAISIRTTPVPAGSGILTVGDFNGDGVDDAVLRTGIYFGKGDGTFAAGPPLPFDVPAGFTATAAVGDFDGDHRLDLALRPTWVSLVGGTFVYPPLTIYSGDGTGHFHAVRDVPDASGLPIHVADVDGDGLDDLIINAWTGIDIVFGRAGAATQRVVTGGTAGYVYELASGDFNGDGRPDLAAVTQAESISGQSELRVWLNDNATMKPVWRRDMRSGGRFASSDMDGDGNDDIVMAAPFSGEAAVIHSNGDGSFAGFRTISALVAGAGASGDFDGDGDDDLLVAGDRTLVLWNDGNGSFHSTPVALQVFDPVTAADVDGDGKAEILTPAGAGILSVIRIARDGSPSKLFDIRTDLTMRVTGIAVGRFSGGAPEVAVVETAGAREGKAEIFDLGSLSTPRFTATLPPSLKFDVAASDINGDGLDDVVVVGEGLSDGFPHSFGPAIKGYASVLISIGRFFEPLASLYQSPTAPLFAPVAGDFDGDGIGDVAFIGNNSGFGTVSITVLYGDHQLRSRSQLIDMHLSTIPPRLTAADLDGDGTDDILTGTGGASLLLFGGPDGIARQESYLGRGLSTMVFAVRSRRGGVPSLISPDGGSTDALLLLPVCGRSRAARHRP